MFNAKRLKKQLESKRKKLRELEEEIEVLQSNCPHPGLNEKHDSNTGNWDPSDDSYWIDYHCKICEKQWRDYL